MAFPTVESVTPTSIATLGTSPALDYPATVNSGELILALFAANDPVTITTPSGFTELDDQQGELPVLTAGVWAKIASGTEGGGSVTFGLSESKAACGQILRISGWSGNIASGISISTAAKDTNNVPNSAVVSTSWGSDDNLFLSLFAAADDDVAHTNAPNSYTNAESTISGAGTNSGCSVGSARRNLAAASDDPGNWVLSQSEEWLAWTIAIAPAVILGPLLNKMMHEGHQNG